MFPITHKSGAKEFIASEEEKELHDKLKILKNKKPKKTSDLTKTELEDLVFLMAKILKIL